MLNLTEEICRKHWQSAEGGLDKAREHRSSVSCGAMVKSITRWRHNTLITFATMQFVFSQQLQKLQKWWKDCDHCRMQETLMSVWQSILLDKWNPVVLDIGVSLLQAFCLDLRVHSVRISETETSLEIQACWNVMLQWGLVVRNAEREGSTFIQTSRTATTETRHHILEGLGPLLLQKCQMLLTNIEAFRRADAFQLVRLCPLPSLRLSLLNLFSSGHSDCHLLYIYNIHFSLFVRGKLKFAWRIKEYVW